MNERPENPIATQRSYWQRVGLSVREGFRMHQFTGQLDKDKGPKSWRNVTQHCLVEVARSVTLGRWIGLPEAIITDIRMASLLHDFDKKQEITATREANKAGLSPITAARAEHEKGDETLKNAAFSKRVRWLASSAGGDTRQLVETQGILDKKALSDDDWAYLIVHYVDDCSIGDRWVIPAQITPDGKRINIIDFRAADNRAKTDYDKIAQEITAELRKDPSFEGMENYDVWTSIFHQIENRLAQRISQRTGEYIDPPKLPELIDQKIRQAIENFPRQ